MGGTAFIFPGQGSQYVGMGRQLRDSDDAVRRLYREASGASGIDVEAVSFEGPRELLDADLNAQVAVFVCNEACRMAAVGEGLKPDIVTGYSLGFYSALVAAGVLGFREALGLVLRAGELALKAGGGRPGGMGAVIGLGLEEVEAVCAGVSDAGSRVWVSNVNAARQILVSGDAGAVQRAVEAANAAGALSAYALPMGAAYHSPVMESTVAEFGAYVDNVGFTDPALPVVSYLDAAGVETAGEAAGVVRAQLARRVLWRDTVTALTGRGVDRFIEVGPGSALSRMVRWVDRSVTAEPVEVILGISAEERAGRV